MNSTNSVNNPVSSTDSSSLLQLYTPQSGNLSVMYYIMEAMMAKLDSSKQCLDDDKDAMLKQEIEQMLQSVDSVDGKEKLLAYLKTVMKNADPNIMGWLNGFYDQVKNYQNQIDEGILKYQEALDKLNQALLQGEKAEKDADLEYQRYVDTLQAAKNTKDPFVKAALYAKAAAIYTAYLACEKTAKLLQSEIAKDITQVKGKQKEIDKEKADLENQIQALLEKSEHSTKDLTALQNDFNQLMKIVQGQLESGWIAKACKWLNDAGDKDIEKQEKQDNNNAENEYPGGGPGVLGYIDKGIAAFLGSLNNSTFLRVISPILALSALPLCFTPIGLLELCIAPNLFKRGYEENIDKKEMNFAQVGQEVVGIELNVSNVVDVLSRLDQQSIAQTIQLNNNAIQDYGNDEKQIQNLAEVFEYVLANNKI